MQVAQRGNIISFAQPVTMQILPLVIKT